MFGIEALHHVSLPVADLERSKQFYSTVLEFEEIERPRCDVPGAWYQLGNPERDHQLHLMVHQETTFRVERGVDFRCVHFALRVLSYQATRQFLRSKGFAPDSEDEHRRMKESPRSAARWPQLYIIDPDRNLIEFNATQLDEEQSVVVSDREQEHDGGGGGDRALLESLRAGDPTAESELMLRFARPFRAMMRARIRDRESAQDASQEALLALLLAVRAGRLRNDGCLQAYAYGIARNTVRRHFRMRTQIPIDDVVPDDLPLTADRHGSYDPYQALVRTAPGRLHSTDAAILKLALAGYTSSEIGQQLSLRSEAVRMRKCRALAKIKARLQRPR